MLSKLRSSLSFSPASDATPASPVSSSSSLMSPLLPAFWRFPFFATVPEAYGVMWTSLLYVRVKAAFTFESIRLIGSFNPVHEVTSKTLSKSSRSKSYLSINETTLGMPSPPSRISGRVNIVLNAGRYSMLSERLLADMLRKVSILFQIWINKRSNNLW